MDIIKSVIFSARDQDIIRQTRRDGRNRKMRIEHPFSENRSSKSFTVFYS